MEISMLKSRRVFSGILATACAAALMLPSVAFGITAEEAKDQSVDHEAAVNNVGDTQYWLDLLKGTDTDGDGDIDIPGAVDNLSIDVPVRVNLALNADGTFVTPTALKNVIENNSEFPVNVKAMSITEKNDFNLEPLTGFAALETDNIFNGKISSVALNDAGTDVQSVKQDIAFTKLGTYVKNSAWGMQSSDNTVKAGDDCLYIQIDGEIGNVAGKYFTAPINVFDITYTFEATSADLPANGGAITD